MKMRAFEAIGSLTMSYRLPPLNGLRAFEASARHLSFKRAADELCVTPGAVNQQVKSLEASLGLQLFRRFHRGLLLTAEGESYLPSISQAFRTISDATEGVAPALKGRRLRVGVSSTLSAQSHPAIENLRRSGAWPPWIRPRPLVCGLASRRPIMTALSVFLA